jgi:hypothetical protein
MAMALPFRPPPGLELPPPPGLEGLRRNADADADALSSCSTADTLEVLESPGYVPGRLLLEKCVETPTPVTLDLEKCVEQSLSMIPPPAPPAVAYPLPSLGSVGHACGLCQPCEFFHKQRCVSGASCKFCHLCGPEEPKARRKAKKIVKRMYRMQREEQLRLYSEER